MIECFENIIGIRTECGQAPVPSSGFYIQDLPGINLKFADSVNQDEDSGYDLLSKKIGMAGEYVASELRNKMQNYFLQNSVIENMVVGYYQDNMQPSAPIAGSYKGIQLEVIESPHLSLFVSSLSFFGEYTGTLPIKVIDLTQGRVIDSFDVEVEAGQITIVDVYKEYKTQGQRLNLFIGYDSTGITAYKSTMFQNNLIGGCTSCRTVKYSWANRFVRIWNRSVSTSGPLIENAMKSVNDSGGLSLTYSLSCSLDRWLCQMKNNLAFAILHRSGMEVIQEAKISNRFNSMLLLKKDEYDALYGYLETKYTESITNVFTNLRLPNDQCFRCNSKVSTGFATL